MTTTITRRTWRGLWSVIMAGLLMNLLAGCAGGTQAADADAAFVRVDGIADASTDVSRPGVPWNLQYTTGLTLEEGLTVEEQAAALDGALVVARDALGPSTNYAYSLYIEGGGEVINLDVVIPLLGAIGEQSAFFTSIGELRVDPEALRAYVSVASDG